MGEVHHYRDGSDNIGLKSDTAATDDTGSWSLISLFKRLLTKLTAGIRVSQKADVLHAYTTPTDPSVPSGASITVDLVLNTEPNVIDSGWILVDNNYPGGNQFTFFANQSFDLYLLNASDASGNNIVGNTSPFTTSNPLLPTTPAALYPDKYYRAIAVNTSGSTATEITMRSLGCQTEPPGFISSLESLLLGFFPARLVRAVLSAKKPDGVYTNINADSSGNLLVANTPTSNPTYSASVLFSPTAVAPTDIFTITGSATKTLVVTRLEVSFSSTNETIINTTALRRSTANTGGTSTTVSNVIHDTTDTAATAVVRAYTTNPTLGTLLGDVRDKKVTSVATPVKIQNLSSVFDFGASIGKPLFLRGTSEVLAINLNSVSVPGISASISIEWYEI